MATGQALPFAPYDEATGTYMDVPSDNKSEEYYRFWAPYCRGKGVLEGTSYELKSLDSPVLLCRQHERYLIRCLHPGPSDADPHPGLIFQQLLM